MLILGKFPSGQQCNAVILRKPVSRTFRFPARTQVIACFPLKRLAHLGLFYVLGRKSSGLCINASNNQRLGGHSVLEVGDFDEDDDFFEEGEEGEEGFTEGDDADDEDDEFIPLVNMKQWLAKKPRGFGEGKVYDTSIEDKLMEEIEQSRTAQLENINNLKKNPVNSISKKDNSKQEKGKLAISEVGQYGFRVCLVNLPKKKNIHKDLDSAFKGVPGILQIVPVVSGNKKTRDPICKGLAFIDFKTENEALSFVQTFSGQSIAFGKVQKQLKCEINLDSIKSGKEQSTEEAVYTAQPVVPSLDYLGQTGSTGFDSDGEVLESAELEDDEEHLEDNQSLPLPYGGGPEERKKATNIKLSSFKPKREPQEKGRKVPSKMKKERIPKMNIPGSANRLKIREKAVLAGVFSKYAASSPLAKES